MARLRFVLTVLVLTSVMAAAPAAQGGASVTGAGEALFPTGATFSGVTLRSLELGQGLFTAADGSAIGQFHVVLQGTSLLGRPQDIIVEGKVTSGTVAANGGVTFSGTATVNMGDGTLPVPGVPFAATVSTNGLALALNSTALPTATLTAGSITIQ